MKRKVLVSILLVLFLFLFSNTKVQAEEKVEYKVGDLVEVINPNGGSSEEFVIVAIEEDSNNKEYLLSSINPIILNKTIAEMEQMNTLSLSGNFKYIEDLSKTLDDSKFDYDIYEVVSPLVSCLVPDNGENFDAILEKETFYFKCPQYKDKYTNIYFNHYSNYLSYIEKSDKPEYDYILRNKNNLSNEEFENLEKTKKFNYFLTVLLGEENLNIIRKSTKVHNAEKKETNNIVNPKTADTNIIMYLAISVGLIIIAISSYKKIKKLN